MTGDVNQPELYCNFCGKRQHEVRILFASGPTHICNECVEICVEVLAEKGIIIPKPDLPKPRATWLSIFRPSTWTDAT